MQLWEEADALPPFHGVSSLGSPDLCPAVKSGKGVPVGAP